MHLKQILCLSTISLTCLPTFYGQTSAPLTSKAIHEFEVASIRPHNAGAPQTSWFSITNTPDGLNAGGVTVLSLIRNAYGEKNFPADDRILDAPGWVKSERFDVHARMTESDATALKNLNNDQQAELRRSMLKSLLIERLKLKAHTEEKERPIYALVAAKNGLKMKEASSSDKYESGLKGQDGKPMGKGTLFFTSAGEAKAQAFSAQSIANFLSTSIVGLERPVLDRTGLTGTYDFTLSFQPVQRQQGDAPPADDTKPSIFTALEEQLGLHLEPTKGPVQFLVIDHIEQPSDN